MNSRLLTLIFLLSASTAALSQSNGWSDLAKDDLDFVHETLRKNHPGAVDGKNQSFSKWLETGYRKAKKKIPLVSSYEGMKYLLQWYGSGFDDGHLFIGPKLETKTIRWPGFVVSKRGTKYVVTSSDNPNLSGALIQKCNDKPIENVLADNVFPYQYGVRKLESDWAKLAPFLLIDSGNPWIGRPSSCRISTKSGSKNLKLDWKKISNTKIQPMLANAAFGVAPKQNMTEKKGLVWISIPSFNPKKADVTGLDEMSRKIGKYRDKKIIVFDVRGNTGGNSQWGENIITNLYGKEYVEFLRSKANIKPSTVEWRVSKDNSEYLSKTAPWLKDRFGAKSDIYKVFSTVASKMKKAVGEGRTDLLLQPSIEQKHASKKTNQKVNSPVKGKVYFLTDGKCASACLDFADKILGIPGVTHIGLPTSADTVYMDVRGVDLPSGIMRLGFAIKVYRDRKRGHNEFYKPSIVYDDDIGNTEKLKQWVLALGGD